MTGFVIVRLVLPDGDEVEVGTLRFAAARGRESAVFVYADTYLADTRAYPIDPGLPLQAGPFVTGERGLFGAMADGSPDRWGQNLLRRAEKTRAREEQRTPRTLGPSDFLLGVHDELRQGALRYVEADGRYLSGSERGVPRSVDLPLLLSLTDRMLRDPSLDTDLRDLVDAGGSLGGARPKAAVRDHAGTLRIAKLPRKGTDEWDVIGWEKLTLDLAALAGIDVPRNEVVTVLGRRVLLLDRFDRRDGTRLGYISAMTLLGVGERAQGISFAEIAEEIDQVSPAPQDDLRQLFRRAVFGALVSNTDNHLRNHGFLRTSTGWTLSPAFDLNPDPERGQAAVPLVPGGGDLADTVEMADVFRLDRDAALRELEHVACGIHRWEHRAVELGLQSQEVSLMRAAFDSPDLAVARRLIS
ncbi:MAG: type II toxin-antitoxin system HipA family toxin [Micrococcales bacterium]|nr:type II toxin-antitoxin system HipA family toxin [Micrococcales bacterium]